MKSDEIVAVMLKQSNDVLAKKLSADVMFMKAPIRFGLDEVIRHEIENLHDDGKKRAPRLAVMLETTGGYVEVVERIYKVFRKHYAHVDFIVPNFAYSAGTVLVMSGDEIYMDYYSVLGPIDPQYEGEDGKFVPGIGYLQKFNEIIDKVNGAKNAADVRAEMAFLLKKFDPALLFAVEHARDHSVSLLEEWLSKHKFKNWTVKETTGKKVTAKDRRERASKIGAILGDPGRWHSHGRGIGLRELTSEEIKLKIQDFSGDAELNKAVRNYYDLVTDYCQKRGANVQVSIHTRNGLRRL